MPMPGALVADAGPDYTSGAMIALYPPADLAAALAQPDGLPAEELHCTVLYLGEVDDLDPADLDELRDTLRSLTQFNAPLSGEVTGVGVFQPDDDEEGSQPAVALLDVRGLAELHVMAAGAANEAGIDPASDHDFIPHMTLTYDSPGAPPPSLEILPLPVVFPSLFLVVGDEREEFAFGHAYQPIEPVEGTLTVEDVDLDADELASLNAALTNGFAGDDGQPVCATCVMPRDFHTHIEQPVTAAGIVWPGEFAGTCTGPGPCDTNPLGTKRNWVTKVGGLPKYIRAIAHALQRHGRSESQAIQMAIGTVKRWAAGGGKVSAATRARAAGAVAEWEAKKAAAAVDDEQFDVDYAAFLDQFSDRLSEFAWNEALHPRAAGGTFAPLGQGAGYSQQGKQGQQQNTDVKSIQRMLQALGISVGSAGVDGMLGPDTGAAIAQFQRHHGLPPTGTINRKTMVRLKHAAGTHSNSRGGGGGAASRSATHPKTAGSRSRVAWNPTHTPLAGGSSRGGGKSSGGSSSGTTGHKRGRYTTGHSRSSRAITKVERRLEHKVRHLEHRNRALHTKIKRLRRPNVPLPGQIAGLPDSAVNRAPVAWGNGKGLDLVYAIQPAGGVPVSVLLGEFADLTEAPNPPEMPTHAGIALKAADTGRVLMLQRGIGDESDPAAGRWEFPGGEIEPGDTTSLHAGMREWAEEVGQPFPEGGVVADAWRAPNNIYQGHVVVIPEEAQVILHQGRHIDNPDDPDGDESEQVAWWHPDDAAGNPALREEVKATPWDLIKDADPNPANDEGDEDEDPFFGVSLDGAEFVDDAAFAKATRIYHFKHGWIPLDHPAAAEAKAERDRKRKERDRKRPIRPTEDYETALRKMLAQARANRGLPPLTAGGADSEESGGVPVLSLI